MTMEPEQARGGEVPERWSAKAKSEVVLRLFRGEAEDRASIGLASPATVQTSVPIFRDRHRDDCPRG